MSGLCPLAKRSTGMVARERWWHPVCRLLDAILVCGVSLSTLHPAHQRVRNNFYMLPGIHAVVAAGMARADSSNQFRRGIARQRIHLERLPTLFNRRCCGVPGSEVYCNRRDQSSQVSSWQLVPISADPGLSKHSGKMASCDPRNKPQLCMTQAGASWWLFRTAQFVRVRQPGLYVTDRWRILRKGR